VSEGWDCHVHVFDALAATSSGHYRPVDHPLSQIEALAQAHGIAHLVLVQPSVYGTDNSVLLRALAAQPGRHRGVVVLGQPVGDAELDAMHALGVRGVRFNLVSPVGESGDPGQRLAVWAPRVRRLGWHVQWYVRAEQLPDVAAWHLRSGLTCVLDHLAGFTPGVLPEHPAWQAVESLARQGAWLKLSGWYRLDAAGPYAALVPHIQRLAGIFGHRLVWGSDWPHTSFPASAMPAYASTWQPVVDALGLSAAQAIRSGGSALYG
jgi:predicted TIM-barrel fold metal-dependent hydrolase